MILTPFENFVIRIVIVTFTQFCYAKYDRAYKLFFIAKNYDKILNEEQKAFMKLVTSNESTSAFADRVAKLVEDAKHNTQWRKQFMDFKHYMSQSFHQGKEEGLQQGLQEGAAKQAIKTATNMLIKEYPVTEISEITGLPQEQIFELQKQIAVKV